MGKLELKGLPNTRDLGGIMTKSGSVIRENRLIRSGALGAISIPDLKMLQMHQLHTVVDFRTEQEVLEKLDQVGEEITYRHLPVLEDLTAGISREKKNDRSVMSGMMSMMANEESAIEYMTNTYLNLVKSPYTQKKYAAFFDLLLNNMEGAILYHCTAGKDRVGFATMLILECLGVDRETIFSDYMQTGAYLAPEVDKMLERIPSDRKSEAFCGAFRAVMGTREEYLRGVYAYIEQEFGSMEHYLEKRIGMDADRIKRMREMYLN